MDVDRRTFLQVAALAAAADPKQFTLLSDPSGTVSPVQLRKLQSLAHDMYAAVDQKAFLAELRLEDALKELDSGKIIRKPDWLIDAAKSALATRAKHSRLASFAEAFIKEAKAIEKITGGQPFQLSIPGWKDPVTLENVCEEWCIAKIKANIPVKAEDIVRLLGNKAEEAQAQLDAIERAVKPFQAGVDRITQSMPEVRRRADWLAQREARLAAGYERAVEHEKKGKSAVETMQDATGLRWEKPFNIDDIISGKEVPYQTRTQGASYSAVKQVADGLALLNGKPLDIQVISGDRIMPLGVHVPGDLLLALPEKDFMAVAATIEQKKANPSLADQELFKNLKAAAAQQRTLS